jgi:magnesium transporter
MGSVEQHLVAIDGSPASADLATIKSMLADGKLLWLDLDAADPGTVPLLRDELAVHPLALRAVAQFGQRPKIERYGDVTYLVFYGARGMNEPAVEVHCFYAERFLITVRRDQSPVLDQLREEMAEQGGPLGQPRTSRPPRLVMLHRILESETDTFFPALSDFDDRIDDLQQKIFARPTDGQLSELFSMQRWLVSVRKLVSPERDMVESLAAGMIELPGTVPESEPYIRDLYDHLIRISDLVDSYRDLLSNAMDGYLSTVSNRLNEVMKQLTIIATVFLPLSFLTGFFGQNFGWLVTHLGSLTVFLALGIGTEVLAVAALFVLARRRGWIGPGQR